MKFLFCFVFFVLCTACAKNHNKPIAELYYVGFVKSGNGLYDLRFQSDVDLLRLFQPGDGFVGGRMKCALSDDTDFSVDNVIQLSAYGPIKADINGADGRRFSFSASVFFRETMDKGRSARTLSDDEVRALLSGEVVIPCKYVATIFNFKPYYSETLAVPVKDILVGIGE